MHLKKGDFVTVLSGRDRGKTGRVLTVDPRAGSAIVEKVAVVKRHARPTQKNPQGGIISLERAVPASRLMVVCMKCRRPTRYKLSAGAGAVRHRVCRHCGESLDKAAA